MSPLFKRDQLTISVVIVTRNRSKFLQRCLDSLMNQNYRNFEIIIVDGGSTDDTKDVISCYPVTFLLQPGIGMCNARNFGIHHAQGEIIAFIDDDAIADENWLRELAEIYRFDSNIGGVGGKVIQMTPATVQPQHNRIMNFFLEMPRLILRYNEPTMQGKIFRGVIYPVGGEDIKEVDWLIGCNMSFRKKVLDEIGGFDENFYGISWGEDADVCIRVKELGCKLIYSPNAI
ncbi:MAG: glycosyltransferase, partial [Candidatus Bathyarchaeia archaeon]